MLNGANTFIVHRYLIKVVCCKLHGEDHMNICVSNVSVHMSASTFMLTCLQISCTQIENHCEIIGSNCGNSYRKNMARIQRPPALSTASPRCDVDNAHPCLIHVTIMDQTHIIPIRSRIVNWGFTASSMR